MLIIPWIPLLKMPSPRSHVTTQSPNLKGLPFLCQLMAENDKKSKGNLLKQTLESLKRGVIRHGWFQECQRIMRTQSLSISPSCCLCWLVRGTIPCCSLLPPGFKSNRKEKASPLLNKNKLGSAFTEHSQSSWDPHHLWAHHCGCDDVLLWSGALR